jgi:hypothetical protein
MLNVCGADCSECPQQKSGECTDTCGNLKGKVFWTKYFNVEVCPIYKCAEEKHFANCGFCEKIPCEMWFSLKDPSLTDEQHRARLNEKILLLKDLVKKRKGRK